MSNLVESWELSNTNHRPQRASRTARPETSEHLEQPAANLSQPRTTIHDNAARQSSFTPSRHGSFTSSIPNESPATTYGIDADLSTSLSFLERGDATLLDVTSILSRTVQQVQQLRKKHRFGVRALTLEPINIPPESAKQWIYRQRWPCFCSNVS